MPFMHPYISSTYVQQQQQQQHPYITIIRTSTASVHHHYPYITIIISHLGLHGVTQLPPWPSDWLITTLLVSHYYC